MQTKLIYLSLRQPIGFNDLLVLYHHVDNQTVISHRPKEEFFTVLADPNTSEYKMAAQLGVVGRIPYRLRTLFILSDLHLNVAEHSTNPLNRSLVDLRDGPSAHSRWRVWQRR